MKITFALLIGAAMGNSHIMSFPDLTGAAVTPTTATTSCFQCIRGGWVWCSAKWNYEGTAPYAASEKGACCYDKATRSTSINDSTNTANVAKCPARWSNAAGAQIT